MTRNKTFINRYSLSKILRDKKKSNEYFETMLANLTMEEVIGLKLEVALSKNPTLMVGLPIWKSTPKFIRDAMLKAALGIAGTKKGAMRLLGMSAKTFNNYLNKLEILEYYKEKGDDTN